ncbi:hypothetical protein BDW72DRAFT_166453 [Aspergillus terricola var. indicus]
MHIFNSYPLLALVLAAGTASAHATEELRTAAESTVVESRVATSAPATEATTTAALKEVKSADGHESHETSSAITSAPSEEVTTYVSEIHTTWVTTTTTVCDRSTCHKKPHSTTVVVPSPHPSTTTTAEPSVLPTTQPSVQSLLPSQVVNRLPNSALNPASSPSTTALPLHPATAHLSRQGSMSLNPVRLSPVPAQVPPSSLPAPSLQQARLTLAPLQPRRRQRLPQRQLQALLRTRPRLPLSTNPPRQAHTRTITEAKRRVFPLDPRPQTPLLIQVLS